MMSGVSVRTRLMLGNVAALAIALMVFAVVIHQVVGALLTRSIDQDLARQAAASAPAVPMGSGPPPERPPAPGGGARSANLFLIRTNGPAPPGRLLPKPAPGTKIVRYSPGSPRDEAPDVIFTRNRTFVIFRVLIAGTHPTVGAPGGGVWNKLVRRAAAGQEGYETVAMNGQMWRSYFTPWKNNGRAVGGVVIAYPLGERDNLLGSLDRTFLFLIPIALLAVGSGAAFLCSRVMRPVGDIAQAAALVEATDLSRRLVATGRDEFSSLAGTFNAMFDRLQAAFQQMESRLELQKQFTADASHELRTPLTAVQANAEWALRRDRTVEEHRDAWNQVSGASRRMGRLVDDLLCLARTDDTRLTGGPVVIADLLRRAAAAYAGNGSYRPAISLEPLDPRLEVWGDPEALVRLVSNLLENAVQYTAESGSVRLGCARKDGFVLITVQDTGEGIPPEHLPHVCERFYRVDSARSRPGGAGLGLAICRSIARQHRGELRIESTPGVGTTATVTLPAMAARSSRLSVAREDEGNGTDVRGKPESDERT